MSRLLTATKPSAPDRRSQSQEHDVAFIYGVLQTIWLDGYRYAELAPAIAKLNAWCERAARWLVDREDHPAFAARRERYADAEEQLCAFRGELHFLEQRVADAQGRIARRWEKLSPTRRATFRADPDFPSGETGEEIARGLWELARVGKNWPGANEAVF
jgi:hypothetical protein